MPSEKTDQIIELLRKSVEEKENKEKYLDKLIVLVEKTLIEKESDKNYREKHSEEHRFLRTLIRESELKAERNRLLVQRLLNGGAWAVVVAVFTSLWFTIKSLILGKI